MQLYNPGEDQQNRSENLNKPVENTSEMNTPYIPQPLPNPFTPKTVIPPPPPPNNPIIDSFSSDSNLNIKSRFKAGHRPMPPPMYTPNQQYVESIPNNSNALHAFEDTVPTPGKIPHAEMYKKQVIYTNSTIDQVPPPSTSLFKVVDNGNCSCRFIRPTLGFIPYTKSLLQNTKLFMGAIIQPLSMREPQDDPKTIPIQTVESGPIRCNRCRAYINPFGKFVGNGVYVCNFCGFESEVQNTNFRSYDEPNELQYGTVDYIVGKEYQFRLPTPLHIVFVIEATYESVSCGLVKSLLTSLKTIISEMTDEKNSHMQISFITFSNSIELYDIKDGNPKILCVGDIDDPFVPLPLSKAMISIQEISKDLSVFDKLESLITPNSGNCAASAIKLAKLMLNETGGHIKLFTMDAPNIGIGDTKIRDSIRNETDQRLLFFPENDFYSEFSVECASSQVVVDTFLFSSTFMESSIFSSLSSLTGGQLYYYEQGFKSERDHERLLHDLRRNLNREIGYEAFMRVRCSTGLSIKRYLGPFHKQVKEEIEITGLDADSTFAIELEHDESSIQSPYIQCALLYTSKNGYRILRVHTLKLGVAYTIDDVFKYADEEALLSFMTKLSVNQIVKNKDPLDFVRKMLNEQLIGIFSAWRTNTDTSNNIRQFVMPKTLQYLPVYCVGFFKSLALNPMINNIDERIASIHMVNRMPIHELSIYCYPRLYALHNIDLENKEIKHVLPPFLPLSRKKIEVSGIYLLHDFVNIFIWVGKRASPKLVKSLIGCELNEIHMDTQPQPDESPLGKRMSAILETLISGKSMRGRVRVFLQGFPAEAMFFMSLIEDSYISSSTDMSYAEYLGFLHKNIIERLK